MHTQILLLQRHAISARHLRDLNGDGMNLNGDGMNSSLQDTEITIFQNTNFQELSFQRDCYSNVIQQ